MLHRSGSISGVAPGDYRSEMFQPPPEPPPKDRWEKDVDAKDCRLCRGQFGMVRIVICAGAWGEWGFLKLGSD